MSWSLALVLLAALVAGWSMVNLVVTLIVLGTKQLIPADRGIAWYFILVSLVAAVTIGALGVHIADLSGLLETRNAVSQEVHEADGN